MTKVFELLPDQPQLFEAWFKLVFEKRVSGKNAHDARLVATMELHQITHLLTFNTEDFYRYDSITILRPVQFAAGR